MERTPSLDTRSGVEHVLPADDPDLARLDLRALEERWADASARTAISAEAMTGADRRAQALGIPGEVLMEHAGTAVAAGGPAGPPQEGRVRDWPGGVPPPPPDKP